MNNENKSHLITLDFISHFYSGLAVEHIDDSRLVSLAIDHVCKTH